MMDCEHCRAMRAHLAATNERLGRPVDSLDDDRDGLPRELVRQDIGDCACACHDHLRIAGRGQVRRGPTPSRAPVEDDD